MHTGDISTPAVLAQLAECAPVIAVRGNRDSWRLRTLQGKLLSAIQNREVYPVGSSRPVTTDVRIISATNQNLEQLVAEKRFREDLFYRLNVVALTMPPLRTLGEDIITIAHHLLSVFNLEFKKRVNGFTPAATEKMRRHAWPGNVRELDNVIQRALILMAGNIVEADDIVFETHQGEAAGTSAATSGWASPAVAIALPRRSRNSLPFGRPVS